MFVITNISKKDIIVDDVSISPKQQLSISHLTEDMLKAEEDGLLRILDSDESLEERRANIKAIESFKP